MESEKDISSVEINSTHNNLISSENENSKNSDKKSSDKKKETKKEENAVSFIELFKYSNRKEKIYIFIAIISSIIQGLTNPLFIEYLSSSLKYFIALVVNLTIKTITQIEDDDTLVELFDLIKNNNDTEKYTAFTNSHPNINLTEIFDKMQNSDYGDYGTPDLQNMEFMTVDQYWDKVGIVLLVLGILGVVSYISSFLYFHFFMLTASLQSTRIRSLTFKSILNQEIEWHENVSPGELSSRIISDTILIEDGIGIKLGFLIEHVVTFVTCYIFAFSNQWLLSLEMSSVIPLVILTTLIMVIILGKFTDKSQNAYAALGGIAQEAFTQIRTIVSFGTEQNEVDRYVEKLKPTRKYGLVMANAFGSCLSLLYGLIYSSLCIAFICGSRAIYNGDMNGEDVYKVFMNIMIGSIYLSTIGSVSYAFGKATGAASKLFDIIERKPKFSKNDGDVLSKPLEGIIEFKNVKFNYPSRPDVEVLKGISFKCNPGKTIALIGASGSGKSTVVQLLEKFYNHTEGQILIDNKDIREYSTSWLRSQIGLVSQEPTLFDTTIEENISIACPNATHEQIEEAAKLANAHDFIMKLPNGYKTSTGERGLQLSGGQKQRICIARALMANPKILLLDEATSALDNKSEKIVQHALDSAAKGRTTLIIAHRLTTIKNADNIIVMEKGVIVESGTHDELIKLGKAYYRLVNNQEMRIAKENELASLTGENLNQDTETDTDVLIDEEEVNINTHDAVEVTRTKSNVSRISSLLQDTKENEKIKLKMDWKRFLKVNKAYWVPNLIGLIGAAGNGAVQPVYAYIFGSALNVFNYHGEELIDKGKYWGIIFLIFSIFVVIVMYMQMGGFYASGECLTYTLRKKMFSSMIRQEIGYFDTNEVGGDKGGDFSMGETSASTGTLTSKLATDATLVQNFNLTVGTILQQIVTIVCGFGIAFACTWKLTLILLIVTPFLFFGTYFIAETYIERNEELRQSFENSSNTACEAIGNIKTVYSLNLEEHFKKIYDERLKEPEKTLFGKAIKSGLGCGLGNCSQFIGNIAGIYFGSLLMVKGEVDFTNMFRAVLAILFTTTAVGEANTIIPNITKSISAFNRVIEVLDRKPKIDARDPSGITKKGEDDENKFKGDIAYKNIKFCYPSRPKVVVLRFGKDEFEVPHGKTCAIVGGSGCGKSTLIGLLLRWYDITTGSIDIDKTSNKSYNIKWLREQMSIVNQEPSLFNISIKDNIRYGKIEATDEEIYEAAKKANIHNFITSLPDGYDTKVGNLGTSQMSGGQKQRIAIARAIIRNPKILLLDEATSALDAESELVVQKALEEVSQGRTTITIAHRLSTIREAHTIIVMKDGYVEEIGNHKKLLENKGEYYNMVLAGDNVSTGQN